MLVITTTHSLYKIVKQLIKAALLTMKVYFLSSIAEWFYVMVLQQQDSYTKRRSNENPCKKQGHLILIKNTANYLHLLADGCFYSSEIFVNYKWIPNSF